MVCGQLTGSDVCSASSTSSSATPRSAPALLRTCRSLRPARRKEEGGASEREALVGTSGKHKAGDWT